MMPSRKIYSGDYEAKLARVMERLGAESYNYDWTRAACFIEFIYHGQLYRFEHSVEKAKTHGQNIVHVSDLFAQLVMTLEDIARMTERGIYELQSWIEGMKLCRHRALLSLRAFKRWVSRIFRNPKKRLRRNIKEWQR